MDKEGDKSRPAWWPKNPYPEDIFPMGTQQYVEAIPDEAQRTAISGCLGRLFWDIAEGSIHDRMCQHREDEAERWKDIIAAARERGDEELADKLTATALEALVEVDDPNEPFEDTASRP